jgi:hypothetical protein
MIMSYDPKIGRFISQDPIKFKAGDADLYRYVGNNVTDSIDPTGLEDYGGIINYINGQNGLNQMLDNLRNDLQNNGVSPSDVDRILDAAQNTSIPYLGWLPGQTFPNNLPGSNHCIRWVQQFDKNSQSPGGPLNRPGNGIKSAKLVYWDTGGFIWPIHAAFRIVLCDGSTYYFDNGSISQFFGGRVPGISQPQDIPPSWKENG